MSDSVKSDLIKWLSESLLTARLTGAGPTRSGNSVQARISFRINGKATIRCITISVIAAARIPEDKPLPFDTLCKDGFHLFQKVHSRSKLPWRESASLMNDIIAELDGQIHLKEKTLGLRTEISSALRTIALDGSASKKKNTAEIQKSSSNIMYWLEHGFSYGMSKEDVDELVNEVLVKHVLKS